MNRSKLLREIYQFYPQGLTAFEEPYYHTEQYRKLSNLIVSPDERWDLFVAEMVALFKGEYVNDRSDNRPSNQCVIFIYKGSLLFEIVLMISRLVPHYAFYIKRHSVDPVAVRTVETGQLVNTTFREIEEETALMLNSLNRYFVVSQIGEADYNLPIPDISTPNRHLGSATVFDAIFTDSRI